MPHLPLPDLNTGAAHAVQGWRYLPSVSRPVVVVQTAFRRYEVWWALDGPVFADAACTVVKQVLDASRPGGVR